MSREIKFRGKSLDKGEWVYGGYDPYIYWISTALQDEISVYPETVGQYTGLKDKNGVEIYEGDIVACPYIDPMGHIHDEEDEEKRSQVVFEHGAFCLKYPHYHTPLVDWCHRSKGEYIPNYGNKTLISNTTAITIIGNIYEHPHLLQQNENK